jgi:GNAT superfamily N-acetyltransferase
MTQALSVRRLQPGDLVDYKALRDAMLAAHPEAYTSDAATERARAAGSYLPRLGIAPPTAGVFMLGAWQREGLIGAIGCERDLRVKVRHIAHVIGMMVRLEARGSGTGGALLDACIAQARATGELRLLTLTVTAGNAPAMRLYERAGFIRYGTLPDAICVDGCYHAKDQMVLTL